MTINKTLHILALCGIGDILSHITRFSNLETKFPDCKLKVWLGGFGKSPQFMKDILELETFNGEMIEVGLIKNLTFHNQLLEMRKFLQDNVVKENDIIQDWSFCDEIFDNKRPVFWDYKMTEGFDYEYGYHSQANKENYQIPKKNTVAIQPLTKSGNAEGFDSDVERGRFWALDNWKEICDKLHADGFTIAITGFGDEDWGLCEYCYEKGYDFIDYVGKSISDTFFFLKQCAGNIACNSWTWEISSRLLQPTVCLFTKNHFFIQNHMPDTQSKLWDTTYIETNNQASPDDVYDVWKYMYDNKKRPEVNYSVCMITLNDKDVISRCTQSMEMYLRGNENIWVDGGSDDGTVFSKSVVGTSIMDGKDGLKFETEVKGFDLKIFKKTWADNFEEQKNYALDQATNEWRVWIDADETYEPIFWNQLPWYIWLAEKNDVDCISVPRINIIEGLTGEELNEYANRNGWQISGFNWINYPDIQQRVFKSNCKFRGRTHERIVGSKRSTFLTGVHCIHPKTKVRQERGFERENRQYEIEAEKVFERVMRDECPSK